MFCKIKKIVLNPFYYSVFMLILAYLMAPAFMRGLIVPLRKAGLVWGFFLLLVFLFQNYKTLLKNRFSVLLFLFCVSNGISILMNYKVNFWKNIVSFGFLCTTLLVIFHAFEKCDREDIKRKVTAFCKINIWIAFLYAVIALVMYCLQIEGSYEYEGIVQRYGLFQNRLWGVFNPNTGGAIAVLAIAFSLYLLFEYGRKKRYIVNIAIQYVYLILTQSRSAYIMFWCMVLILLFFVGIKGEIKKAGVKYYAGRIGKAILIVLALLLLQSTVKKVVPICAQSIANVFGRECEKNEIKRLENFDEDNIDSVSNGRVTIWKTGINLWKQAPVMGTSPESIVAYAKETLNESTAETIVGGGLHNIYLTILVSSGCVGSAIFILFLLCVAYRFMRYLIKEKDRQSILLIGLCAACLVGDLVESRIVYGTSCVCYVFWIVMGVLCSKNYLKAE